MKYCPRCDSKLPISDFGPNKSRKDGLQGACIACMKEYRKQHYAKNKQVYKDRAKSHKAYLRSFTDRYKSFCGCSNCSESRYWVLEFHHRDSQEKDENVAILVSMGSLKKLKDEIRKCDVLCANCHKDVHHRLKFDDNRDMV